MDTHGYLSACEWLDAGDAPQIVAETERVRADPEAAQRLEQWVSHYFGDTTPGAATRRFHDAIARLMAEWDDWHARSTEDDEPDDVEEEAELDD